jgi:hypothetical protein
MRALRGVLRERTGHWVDRELLLLLLRLILTVTLASSATATAGSAALLSALLLGQAPRYLHSEVWICHHRDVPLEL